jgi:hypothetical protein
VRERAVVTAVQDGVRIVAGRAFVGMGAVVQGVAGRVQGVHEHGVVVVEGGDGHAGGVENIIGLGSVVEEAHIAQTDHATL